MVDTVWNVVSSNGEDNLYHFNLIISMEIQMTVGRRIFDYCAEIVMV